MNRAYSILDIKSVDEDQRIIEGIASTPSADRMGDVVEPMGAQFKLPMPLLWQHDSRQPIGEVFFAKPTKNGIPFKAKLAQVDEPGKLKDRLDEAWQSIKIGLVRAVSIGFRSIEYSIMEDGGWRFLEWEWLELSAVTIPANADATIQTIKSIDTEQRAASGRKLDGDDKTPPAPRHSQTKVVKAQEANPMKKTIAEQIAGFKATRADKAAKISAILEKAADEGVTLDAAQKEEHDDLVTDVKEIDEHIERLENLEKINLAKASPVEHIRTVEDAGRQRDPIRVQVLPKKVEQGIGFTRMVMAIARAQGNLMQAHEIAKANEQWRAETPDVEAVLKTAVSAGTVSDSTWAAPLVQYQNLANEFIEYTRPLTIIGRIPGLRRVPFKVKIPRQTGASSVGWVGEAKVRKVSALAFDSVTLDFANIAGIVVISKELLRHGQPSSEMLVRDDLAKGIVQFMDGQFVDPTKASDDVSPASITYGVTPVTATGTNAAALRADIKSLVQTFLDNDLTPSDGVWIMSQGIALAISLMTNDLGNPEFPGITMNGGTLQGLPVVTSESVPATGGSPTDGALIILAKAGDILLADEGGITVDASREASLQMDDAPDSPATASTNLISLFQHGLIGIRAEREINWKKRRSTSVQFIQSAKYTDA